MRLADFPAVCSRVASKAGHPKERVLGKTRSAKRAQARHSSVYDALLEETMPTPQSCDSQLLGLF